MHYNIPWFVFLSCQTHSDIRLNYYCIVIPVSYFTRHYEINNAIIYYYNHVFSPYLPFTSHSTPSPSQCIHSFSPTMHPFYSFFIPQPFPYSHPTVALLYSCSFPPCNLIPYSSLSLSSQLFLTFLNRYCSINDLPPLFTDEPVFNFSNHCTKIIWATVH